MTHDASWTGESESDAHATRRTFLIRRESGPVPGTVWLPKALSGPIPLVLIGHGGSGDRHSARVTSMTARFIRSGFATAAIDGPYHGERVTEPLAPAEYQARIAAEGIETVLDRTAEDWLAARDLLVDVGIADRGRLAYFGLSFGARFGLAAAAGLGPGLRCAVFGKFGVQQSPELPAGLNVPARSLRDAARIAAPVLFHMQWHDELFPRAGQLDLFDAFPDPAKELHAFTGPHGRTPEHAPDAWHDFVARHLHIEHTGTLHTET